MKNDLTPREDWTGASIIFSLLFVFLAFIGASFYSTHGEFEKVKEMLDKLLPAVTALTGCALGFYFGSESKLR